MKLFTGWVLSAGLVFAAAAANAQVRAPDQIGQPAQVSDIDGPYAAMPPDAPVAHATATGRRFCRRRRSTRCCATADFRRLARPG